MTPTSRRPKGPERAERRELLARLLQRRAQEPRSCRLSFAQARLWFLEQLRPGTPVHNIPAAFRLLGALDAAALQRALAEVSRRQEALRTSFQSVRGEPAQVVAPEPRVELRLVDLSREPRREREAAAWRVADAEARLPFDLGRAPLMRVILLRLAQEEHILVLVIHHLVADGWSLDVLYRELGALYPAFAGGRKSPLPDLPAQYADYTRWQHRWAAGETFRGQLGYWRERLAALPTLELPTDRPRPAVQSGRGSHIGLGLDPTLAEPLDALARQEEATRFMVFLAAFQALLGRYTGQDDIVVGTPIAGRNRSEVQDLIGFFVNTLVIRAEVDPADGFRALLRRVRAGALEVYANQDIPFEKLVEVLEPERDLSSTPLFQVLFAVQTGATLQLPGIVSVDETHRIDKGTTQFDLAVVVHQGDGLLEVRAHYSTDLFEPDRLERLLDHYRTLLTAALGEPDRPLGGLPLLTPAEQRRLTLDWNATEREFPGELCAHEVFERQAGRVPEATAVICGGERLSYAELDRRANQLAHYLRRLGIGPERLVGLCLDRSPLVVVAVLGVMKAGGAYVPLDPAYPADRLEFMARDAGLSLILTQEHLKDGLAGHTARLACLDSDWEAISRESVADPERTARPDNLAYVIYTSGSTGVPKGVMLSHRGLVNLAGTPPTVHGVHAGSRKLQFASLSFDASVWEMFLALGRGASLVLATEEELSDPERLAALLAGERVTAATLPPSMLSQLPLEAAASLESLVTAGEACPPGLAAAWAGRLTLINAYGPTETTVCATSGRVPPEVSADRSPPIGTPLPNTRVYVLDRRLQPVPSGVPGELYVGGVGLARGYLGRPGLTAERFVPDPLGPEPGARLYRTGDLACWTADGSLEFLGRIDHQVKLRGFRIELGEVEAVLAEHPAVREAVAVVREDRPGDRRLVAYCVPAADTAPPASQELTAHLRDRLPAYMLPAAIVALDALPLLPNGKVDRRSLPAPEPARPEGADFVAPRTPQEEMIADIWASVIGLERVGVEDNFFAIGGHSLLATQVISRVREAFGVELPVRALFDAPTVAGLADCVRRAGGVDEALPEAPPIRPVARDGYAEGLPLSFAQARLWFLNQYEPESPAYHIPLAIRLRGDLDLEALEAALTEIVRRHEALRTTFRATEGDPVQVVVPPSPLSLPVDDLGSVPEEQRRARAQELAEAEARHPFDLAAAPPLRARLLRLAPDDHLLLLTLHHIVADGWSMGVFYRELAALYRATIADEVATLPELPIQYPDYALWQRRWLEAEGLEHHLAYWRDRLQGLTVLELPADRPRPLAQTYRGARALFEIDPETTQGIRALGRESGTTLFMTLLAAFKALLHRYTGQDDLAVGSVSANRNRAELEGLIGFFVNTLVLRTPLAGDPSFREALGRVRETALGAYAHQEVPFERLVEELEPERSLSRTPLVQVMFTLQTDAGGPLALPGLMLECESVFTGTAKFDLTLDLAASGAGLRGEFEYNSDLFTEATIRRLAGHFQQLLRGIVADPDRRLSGLPLMAEDERKQAVVAWNETKTAYPRDRCVHELFREQAAAAPESVAVAFGDRRLTYGGLDRLSDGLARCLSRRGVAPGDPVGLFMERSPAMVVATLAILKAGGTYVPLDPDYPSERLELMLRDSGSRHVVVQESLRAGLPSGVPEVIGAPGPDSDWEAVRDAAGREGGGEPPRPAVPPGSTAYIMYTSGSTGRPKGVCIPHRAICRLVRDTDYVRLDASDRVAQVSNASFDAITFELWGALLNGARLVGTGRDTILSPPDFAAWLKREEITTMFLTTALFNQLAREAPAAFAGMRRVLFGGEACDPGCAARVLAAGPPDRVLHVYGPTENTTFTTWHTVERVPEGAVTLPIGRPVANTTVYVLDRRLEPVPVGVTGELYTGGDGLAVGYLNRPGLTAERFIPDPVGPEAGGRLYRTGDLARRLPDGSIEFLGRTDDQVKIRGFRIEPAEVETVLGEHPAVHETAVVVREEAPGERYLAAYIAPVAADRPPEAAELRSFLEDRLPDYMIPKAFVTLESLPLNPNGKVDRRALPAPDLRAGEEYVAPRGPVETLLADIWTQVLGVDRPGVRHNFFELGGHSLLATRVVSAVNRELGIEVPLRTMFERPTVAGLAAVVDEALLAGAGSEDLKAISGDAGGQGR